MDYTEGNLNDLQRDGFEKHLKKCPQCHEELQGFRQIQQELHRVDTHKTSADFDVILRARIRREKRVQSFGWFSRHNAAVPAYLLSGAMLVLAFVLFQGQMLDLNQQNVGPLSFVASESHFSNTLQPETVVYEIADYSIETLGNSDETEFVDTDTMGLNVKDTNSGDHFSNYDSDQPVSYYTF
ncbi:hypothetical protein KAH55_05290 [bacterium]|nr:hypothetical protein [bacterium]